MSARRLVYMIQTECSGTVAFLAKAGDELVWRFDAKAAMRFDERDGAERFAAASIDGSYSVEAMPTAWLH
jgi:hypothetical protein